MRPFVSPENEKENNFLTNLQEVMIVLDIPNITYDYSLLKLFDCSQNSLYGI